jgi:hypothetical protein
MLWRPRMNYDYCGQTRELTVLADIREGAPLAGLSALLKVKASRPRKLVPLLHGAGASIMIIARKPRPSPRLLKVRRAARAETGATPPWRRRHRL